MRHLQRLSAADDARTSDPFASDGSTKAPVCSITAVTSNELPSLPSDTDWVVTGPLALEIRADRAGGGNGRIYTITVTCGNGSPFTSAKGVTVSVPHDQGQ